MISRAEKLLLAAAVQRPSPAPPEATIDKKQQVRKEATELAEHATPRTPVIYEVVRRHGEEEMGRPAVSLWWSGVAAGLSISFSVLAQAVLGLNLPDMPARELVTALGYPVGFLMVVLGRQQLFTENTITMVLPVMAKPSRACFASLARVWSIVLGANLAGTFLAAAFCTFAPVIAPETLAAMLELGRPMFAKSWLVLLFQGITAGYLMATMVWLLPSAEGTQFHVVALVTYLIAISGSAHIVAGSVEAFLLLLDGSVGVGAVVGHFAVPVLLGNIVGGTVLFALLSYAQVMKEL